MRYRTPFFHPSTTKLRFKLISYRPKNCRSTPKKFNSVQTLIFPFFVYTHIGFVLLCICCYLNFFAAFFHRRSLAFHSIRLFARTWKKFGAAYIYLYVCACMHFTNTTAGNVCMRRDREEQRRGEWTIMWASERR